MTTLEINLTDGLAKAAEQTGLLTSKATERMLKSELGRRAGLPVRRNLKEAPSIKETQPFYSPCWRS